MKTTNETRPEHHPGTPNPLSPLACVLEEEAARLQKSKAALGQKDARRPADAKALADLDARTEIINRAIAAVDRR